MQHRPAEVRVSNYSTGVLRIVQRDAEANGVFVQPRGVESSWELPVLWLKLLRRIWEDEQGAELCAQGSFHEKMV